jgi:hypothetical protein
MFASCLLGSPRLEQLGRSGVRVLRHVVGRRRAAFFPRRWAHNVSRFESAWSSRSAMCTTSRRWVEPQSTHRCPSRASTIARRRSQSDGSCVRGRRRHPLSVMAFLRLSRRLRQLPSRIPRLIGTAGWCRAPYHAAVSPAVECATARHGTHRRIPHRCKLVIMRASPLRVVPRDRGGADRVVRLDRRLADRQRDDSSGCATGDDGSGGGAGLRRASIRAARSPRRADRGTKGQPEGDLDWR